LLPDHTRHSAAHHLELASARILFDCGPGTLHGFSAHGVAWADLTHLVVTHYHGDHVGDLAAILFALKHGLTPARAAPLTLIGPVGFRAFLTRLADALGDHVLSPGFELGVVELEPGTAFEDATRGFSLECHPTPHTAESVAYRLEAHWGAIGYTGDTGPSTDVAMFLSGCQVLVAECALTDPPEMELHLSPVGLAEMAGLAEPELLVVTHVYPPLTPDQAVARITERYGGATLAAADGLRISLGAGGPTVDPPPTAI